MILVANITNRCNMKCKMCDVGQGEKRNTFGRDIENEIFPDQWLKIVDRLGATEVVFCGVEPLLYHDFENLVKLISKTRNLKMTTNGWFLEKYLHVIKGNFKQVTVSLDGTQDIHDKIRGVKGCFERAFRGLLSLKKLGVPVRVSFAITPENTCCMVELFDILHSQNIPIIFNHFNYIHPEIAKRYELKQYNTKVYNAIDVNIEELYFAISKLRKKAQWLPYLSTKEQLIKYYQSIPVRNGKGMCRVFLEQLGNKRCIVGADGTFIPGNRCWIDKSLGNALDEPLTLPKDSKWLKEMVSSFEREGLPEPCYRLCCSKMK